MVFKIDTSAGIMVSSNFTSRTKVMAFSVFGLSILLSFALLFLVSPSVVEPRFWNEPQSFLVAVASISIFAFGCLTLRKMKSVRIEQQRIVFQRCLFGSNIRTVNLKNYDYYKIVHEETENGFFEAVWLIKDGKLVDSFSTYQYSNYREMKKALNLENKGELELSPMKQLLCRFGSKI